jgi:hypothetical protein
LRHPRAAQIYDREFPVEIDGEYVGELSGTEFGMRPAGLLALS